MFRVRQGRFLLGPTKEANWLIDARLLGGRRSPRLPTNPNRLARLRCPITACCRHYPDAATGRIASLTAPSRISLPRSGGRVGLRIVLFEACSAFTRVTACTLALSPY